MSFGAMTKCPETTFSFDELIYTIRNGKDTVDQDSILWATTDWIEFIFGQYAFLVVLDQICHNL